MEPMKWHLQIVRTTWVLWGYGPRESSGCSMHCDRAVVKIAGFCKLPFELPESNHQPAPQEHERRDGYGWRWNLEDGTAGHAWHFAESPEECIEAAKRGLEHQRFDTQLIFNEAIKDVRVTDELKGATP